MAAAPGETASAPLGLVAPKLLYFAVGPSWGPRTIVFVKKLAFPRRPVSPGSLDFGSLSHVLFESADLLESARGSEDAEFQAQAVELAIRALYAGSAAIDRQFGRPAADAKPQAQVIQGPWAAGTS